MNKQSIKVLLASGALSIAAIFGGCNNGTTNTPTTCTCNPKDHKYEATDACNCGADICDCTVKRTYDDLTFGSRSVTLNVPESGLAENTIIAIQQELTRLVNEVPSNLFVEYNLGRSGILTINVIDGTDEPVAGDDLDSFSVGKSALEANINKIGSGLNAIWGKSLE
jgi:hypothetical protein